MKLYKIRVTGDNKNFNIEYEYSTNFVDYKKIEYQGSEQEKYQKFLQELEKNADMNPVNVKVKMNTKFVDRAYLKSEIIKIKDVNDFINRL